MTIHELRKAVHAAAVSGSVAALTSAAALSVCSKIEEGTPAGALNGPSQWLWGEREAYTRRATWRHTATGYVIHHATAVMWATLHEYVFADSDDSEPRSKGTAMRCAQAAATATTAYLVDYSLTPKRFRPGFKKHLGPTSMFAVYGTFAAGIALTAILRDRRSSSVRLT